MQIALEQIDELRELAIQAAITEMSLFNGNLEMKVRKAIDRYEWILHGHCAPGPVRKSNADCT